MAGLAPVINRDVTGNDSYKFIGLGVLIISIFVLLIVLSTVLFAFEKTKPFGKSALLSAGIVLLTGFSICSIS